MDTDKNLRIYIGVWSFIGGWNSLCLAVSKRECWTKLAGSLKEFVESVKAMVDAVGIDHTGIGTDTDLLSSREGQGTNQTYPGLTGGFFPAAVAEMLRQGFTPDEIAKVGGGNYCRVFGKATAGRA